MGDVLLAIACVAVIGAGWFYLSRSTAVSQLEGLESPRRNFARRRARRFGSLGVILAGLGIYWLTLELRWRQSPARIAASLLVVLFALSVMMLSVIIDIYLTHRVSRQLREQQQDAIRRRDAMLARGRRPSERSDDQDS